MGRNTEIVREGLDAFFKGDLERALAFADPDVVSVRHAPIPDPQTYRGREGILEMLADWTTDFDEFEMEALEYREVGDRVLVDVEQRGIGKASGVEVAGRFWISYTFVDGRVTRMEAFLTLQQALG
jgi:ketosteroid isomerase-like protein